MTTSIAKNRKQLVDRIDKLHESLKQLQTECQHPNVIKKHHSNTGNYDPSDDCYWTTFYCPDCHKQWTVDGSK